MAKKKFYKNLSHEELQQLIYESTSIREVLIKLGCCGSGSYHTDFSTFLKLNNFDTSTLVGRSIGRNTCANKTKTHLINTLIEKGSPNSSQIKKRLIAYGVKEDKCENCGITEWLGQPISMELHHINGNHCDNRLENLIILCPNCHSLTPNFRGKGNAYSEEKRKYNELLEKIAKKDAEIKLPKMIQESIELKNKPRPPRKSVKTDKIIKPKNRCIVCGKETSNKTFCSFECYNIHNRKHIASKEHLLEISKRCHSLAEMNRELNAGVTDNALKKWCNQYGIYQDIKKNFIKKTYTILQYDLDGNFIKEWDSGDQIVRELYFNKSKIQACCNGKKPQYKGFIWKYKNR